jgi:glycosyltransferase involved in cell wall biosynthesis
VSIVIPHFNYSHLIEDAIKSVLDQSHTNWECVIVDDRSEPQHVERLKEVVALHPDARIKVQYNQVNQGQVPTFFSGLERTTGDFVCLLDPDDRYTEHFLESVLRIHLTAGIMVPVVSTDQFLATERGVLGSGIRADMRIATLEKKGRYISVDMNEEPNLLLIRANEPGWHWTSTSAIMFRRAALNYLKPHKALAYKGCADGYLAQGAHALGGTLFWAQPMIYRLLHNKNAWIAETIYSSFQNKQREGAGQWAAVARVDALEAIRANGNEPAEWRRVANNTAPTPKKSWRRHLTRWGNSLGKRLTSHA